MRSTQRRALVLAIACAACGLTADVGAKSQPSVRQPAVAGQFYPAEPARLKGAIEAFLRDGVPPRPERPIAIVVPHAGYIYSGQIAADAFRQASPHHYDTVVILGTNHTDAEFTRIAVQPGTGFQTPLGSVPIDDGLRNDLLKGDSGLVADARVHAREHSVEVQVPFVQHVFPSARIVPIVIGQPDVEMCTRFGRALAKAIGNRQVLIVASSDLSHYASAENASAVDRRTLESIVALDPGRLKVATREQMGRRVPDLVTCACGEGPVMAAMAAAVALGATRGTVISYANSGDVPVGDPSRVVGYGAVVMTSGKRGTDTAALTHAVRPDADSPLQPSDKKALLTGAREAIERFLTTDTVPLARGDNPRLARSNGVFVTLRKGGELRGCIGRIVPDIPLRSLTGAMALEAAFEDPRFSRVRTEELKDIDIEVSVLTPLKPVASAGTIVPGRDGVVLRKNGQAAVFLPQVATEQGWSRDELLDQLCLKAGLPAACWRSGAELAVFQADTFGEKQFR